MVELNAVTHPRCVVLKGGSVVITEWSPHAVPRPFAPERWANTPNPSHLEENDNIIQGWTQTRRVADDPCDN